ncbi:MAG: glycosyltransferase family 87 protein [Ktedonobacterales bacterium]
MRGAWAHGKEAPRATIYLRAAVGMLLLASIAWYGYAGVFLPLHATGYDFTGPYEAAYALAHHAKFLLYDVAQQRAFNHVVLHLPDGPSDFRWTPQTAALLVPLGYLPYAAAHMIWYLLSQITLFISLAIIARCLAAAWVPAATPRSELVRVTLAGFVVLLSFSAWSQPVTDSVRLGQSTPLLLFGFALLLFGEVFDRPVVAGCGLGLAILIKLFPALLLVYFVYHRRYRLIGVTVGFTVVLTLLTLPMTGIDLYRQFIVALQTYQVQPNAGPVNLSLYHAVIVGAAALLHLRHGEPTAGPLNLAAKCVCVVVFGCFLVAHEGSAPLPRRIRALIRLRMPPPVPPIINLAGSQERAVRRLGLTAWATCTVLLVEPVDWAFYYLLLLIPLAWLLAQLPVFARRWHAAAGRTRHWLWLYVAAWCGYAVSTVPLPFDTRTAVPLSAAYVVGICIRPVALLLLWLSLWVSLGSSGATSPSTVNVDAASTAISRSQASAH